MNQTRITKDKDNLEKIKAVTKATIIRLIIVQYQNWMNTWEIWEEYLLAINDESKKRRDAFIKECTVRPSWFEEPIKKVKIFNFAAENILKKKKSKQVAEIANSKGTCDWMFEKLSFLSVRKNIDLNIVCQYPHLSEPPYFVDADKSLCESKRSSVIHFLK